ncbi:helix-turn-helix domain-containing protein [Burkholderia sp. WP9]|uniref:helix-turn-helix domain-containing protein n=1 Tax=Burkholderia sp. WP9 TaxID=1500263 RepID=UPI000B80EFE8|nr:helix-turn-helix domain-containing protein [Burkholderia sp. WP9]
MKVRKLKHMRAAITAGPGRLNIDEAARLLHVSRECFDRLVRSVELSAIRHAPSGGRRWFSMAQLLAYKRRCKIQQRSGLTRMMKATERLGLYDAELKGLPRR